MLSRRLVALTPLAMRGARAPVVGSRPMNKVFGKHAPLSSAAAQDGQGLVKVERLPGDKRMAIINMARAPVNSLNLDLVQHLTQAIQGLEQDPEVQGFILASSQNKVFCAGIDLVMMHQPKADDLATFWSALQTLWYTLYGTRLATVAAIQGAAPAAGCLLAISCDYRVMAKGHSLGMNETKFGLVAPPWFQQTLVSTVGLRHAESLLLKGMMVPSGDALRIGMIDEEVDESEVMLAAEKELGAMLSVSDRARQTTKVALRMPMMQQMKAAFDMDRDWFMSWVQSPEIQAGLGAYLESLKKKKK
mmetsp:Transcript_15209/g.35033  ORF Transcript_15209/g.35033 Transcript_15209/m.35033 type:complete len:304 (+) Transcript_15209:65-976(+)